jgi:hypothetical protein
VGPGRADPRQPRGLVGSGGVGALPPADKVAALHRSLAQAQIPHAFGGALALAYYAEPRPTTDIDVNVFLPAQPSELKLDWEGTPVHFFFSCDPLHEEMERRVREVPFGDDTIPLIAPEHLIVRKRLLGRPKDERDIERILAATAVDEVEVEEWVARLTAGD